MVKKNMIPDRSAQSLKTAFRKFQKYSKEEFIRAVNTVDRGRTFRYSHQEAMPPVLGPGVEFLETDVSKEKGNSQETKVNSEEVKEFNPGDKTPEASDDESGIEFVLAVDDLQSVISYRVNDSQMYNMNDFSGKKGEG